MILREAAKNCLFFSGRTFKRWGGGLKAGPLRKKTFFLKLEKKSEKSMTTLGEGEGLSGRSTKKNTFLAASLTHTITAEHGEHP